MHPCIRRSIAVVLGSVVAVLIGVVAGLARSATQDGFVFATATAPILIGALWTLLPGGAPEGPEHREDTVEYEWMLQASSGTFLDLVLALGAAVTVASVLGVDDVPAAMFLVLAMADFAVRYWSAQRRSA